MSRPHIIFYLLVLYVFASFLWWTYLLVDSNTEIFQSRRELLDLKQTTELAYRKSKKDFYRSENFEELQSKYRRRIWMIAGEGAVFFILLGFGIWRMRKSIQKEVSLAAQQKNFLLSITHELKSPVSSIKLALQTLFKHNLDKEKSERLINNALDDSQRLHDLVDNILLAAKIENQSYHFIPENFDFSAFINEIFSKIKEQHRNQPRNYELNIEPNVFINGDRIAIHSLVSNLLENAIKYSDNDSKIILNLKQTGKNILLEVKDNGIGISYSDKEKIFEKFYRAGNEETRKSTGTGLGLFIVKEIVNAHRGKIFVRDNQPKGTIFQVYLPNEEDF